MNCLDILEPVAVPFGWLLMRLYILVNDYALSLILIAIIVRVLLIPVQMKAKRGQMRQARLQPKIAELQKKHGANKQKLNEEQAKLFKEEGINPASGCLWGFIQMPIMIAIFYAIRQPLTLMMGVARELLVDTEEATGAIVLKLRELNFEATLGDFYLEVDQAQFISRPENWVHFTEWVSDGLHQISFFLGPLNLANIPQWQVWNPEIFPWNDFNALYPVLILFLFPIISGGAQFISMGIMRKLNPTSTPEGAGGAMGNVMRFMPLMSVWFGFILPAALSVYWTIGTVLQIGQDVWLTKKYTKILDAEDAEKAVIRKAKEAELETKRLEKERKKAKGILEENKNTSKRKKKKGNKQEKREKAADWEKKKAPKKEEKYEPSRIGNRKYARGRAYDPGRYAHSADGDDESSESITEDEDVETEQVSDSYMDVEETEADSKSDIVEEDDDDSDDGDDDSDYDNDDDGDDDDSDDDSDYDNDDDGDDDSDDDSDDEDISESPATVRFDTKRFDSEQK